MPRSRVVACLLLLAAGLLPLGATGCGGGSATSARAKILFLSNRDGDWALYAMNANGRHVRRVGAGGLVDPIGEEVGFGNPIASPDGRRVVVAKRGLTVYTLATGTSRRIGPGDENTAAWSPDGTRVVFSRNGDGLYIVDVRDGERRVLFRKSSTWSPAWSPDGTWIAFARAIGYGPMRVYAVHPDGSGLRRLTNYAPMGTGGLAWSGDGRLAVMGRRGNEERDHLLVVDVPTGRIDVVASRVQGGDVAWSPDGRRIAYTANYTIYTVDADGSDRHRLTPSWPPAAEESPVWSPDGKSLLFVRRLLGGGAQRDLAEVWTMRADGSRRHALATAYPDGGDNLAPAWVSAPVHIESAPRTLQIRHGRVVVLRVPFAVDGIAAEDDRAAIAPVAYDQERPFRPTPPLLVWRPGPGEPSRVVVAACGGVGQLVLARDRLALDCSQSYFDFFYQSVWVYDLRTRRPREVFLGHAGPDQRGVYLDNIVGGGRLLAFGSERKTPSGVVRRRALWRVDGFDSIALSSRSGTGDVVAADGGRMAAELADGRVAILRPDGRVVRVLRVRRGPTPAARGAVDGTPQVRLDGRALLLLEHRTLRAYDTVTGRLRFARRVPPGAQLEGANGGAVVYSVGSSLHVLSTRDERVIHTAARGRRRLGYFIDRPVHAALTPAGLYYSFNVADVRYPGRVVFVPRRALLR